MKNKVWKLLCFMCLMLIPFSFVNAECNDYFSDDSNCTEVNHSVFIADEDVNYSHKVNGIGFFAGSNLNIGGANDYSFMAGNNVTYTGYTDNDLFVAGSSVNISGDEDSDVVVGRDLFAAGNSVTINSNIQGNAFIAGNTVTLKGVTIDGDLNIAASKLVLEDDATINGTINYNSDMEFDNKDVLNATNLVSYDNNGSNFNKGDISSYILSWLMFLIMLIIFAFVINLVCPKLHDKLNESVKDAKSEVLSTLWGFVILVMIPIIAIFLLISGIGIYLAVFVILCYLLLLMLSIVATSMIIGKKLLNNVFHYGSNSYLNIIIGIILLKLIEIIPYVGGIVYFIAFVYGLGKLIDIIRMNISRK